MTNGESKWTAVFVHGIFSSGDTFKAMADAFDKSPAFAQCAPYNYNYNRSMKENAKRLAEKIKDVAAPVVLVCHSMGGLIARLAVLNGGVPNVRRVIMLGTPNFGAIRTATAGLLAQFTLRTAGRIATVFRRPGILELTRVTRLLEEPIRQGEKFARNVEYVTIAGTFFNESRETDLASVWTSLFTSLEVGADLLRLVPFWRSEMTRPHDGIVEETSNDLSPFKSGRLSEKRATLLEPGTYGFTYAHVRIDQCDKLIHVEIHRDPEIISLVTRIAGSPSLMEWFNDLTPEERLRIVVEPRPQ